MPDERTAAFSFGLPAQPGVLLLHGFTGSPAELRPFGQVLSAHGYHTVAPCYPGHGQAPPDLASAGADDWLSAARGALAGFGKPVHLVGLSMGALLALRLAREQPDSVRSLTLLAPALRLTAVGRWASLLLWRVPALYRSHPTVPIPPHSDLRDPTLAGENPKAARLSLYGLAELQRLQRETAADTRAVRAPVLIALGALDRTVSNAAAKRLSERLAAALLVLPRSGHQLGLDHDRAQLAAAVLAHFQSAEAQHGLYGPKGAVAKPDLR